MFNHEPDGYECFICDLASGGDEPGRVVYEDADTIAFISRKRWPNNPGNVMVSPKEHVENVYDISDELLGKVYAVAKKVALAMKSAYGCDGTSFRQHNEPAGNQNVWHFHLHVFPRWENDDLYSLHKESYESTEAERAEYAEKLRGSLQ